MVLSNFMSQKWNQVIPQVLLQPKEQCKSLILNPGVIPNYFREWYFTTVSENVDQDQFLGWMVCNQLINSTNQQNFTAFNQLIANLQKERFIWFKIMKQLLPKETRCTPHSMKPILFEKCPISVSIYRLFMLVICLSLILIRHHSFLQCRGF